ncbi:MAG: hypothetical protein JNJ54_22910 [Myxococcaceae bacterium]|nr:hypothetical protein [Myxococcaceae bacterium]
MPEEARASMAQMLTYTQPTKSKARSLLLECAVRALTERRDESVVVRAGAFDETFRYSVDCLRQHGVQLPDDSALRAEVVRFEALHGATVAAKRPSDLRVLYLCGPEPNNDLDVLVGLGVAPENIWAVESHAETYRAATDQLIRTGRFPKVHRGNTESFFRVVHEQFDFVYFDACGPLLGGQPNTLRSLLALFEHNRLSPLSALVTNFAEPSPQAREAYSRSMCAFFAMRYNDCPRALWDAGADPAISMQSGGDREHLLPYVERNFGATYSDFVTRLVVDVGRQLIPFARAHDIPEVEQQYFAPREQQQETVRRSGIPMPGPQADETSWRSYFERVFTTTGVVNLIPSSYPLLHFLEAADRALLAPFHNYKLSREMLRDAFWSTSLLAQMMNGTADIASPQMMAAVRAHWLDNAMNQYFCDIPFPHLMVSCLLGIYGRPYFVNPRRSTRCRYVAKATPMFADCLVLDQCRYLFDYFPTIDLVPSRMRSVGFQLVARSCIDQIQWHDFSSSTRVFDGAALAGMGALPHSKPHDFEDRVVIE